MVPRTKKKTKYDLEADFSLVTRFFLNVPQMALYAEGTTGGGSHASNNTSYDAEGTPTVQQQVRPSH